MLIFYVTLLIIHFLIKDRFQNVSVIYYASPLPLIILFGLFVTIMNYRHKPLFYVLSFFLLGISGYFCGHYFGSEFETTPSKETSHILFWNAAGNQPLPTDILIKHIKTARPEILALVETENISDSDLTILKTACPDYNFQTLEGAMLIAIKGQIIEIIFKEEERLYRSNRIVTTIDDKPVTILIADVSASPFRNKEIPLSTIAETAKKHKIDVLVGDFNTPYESVFFKDFKRDYYSFHPFSIGLTSTWPIPIPLIEIDQIWVAKSLQPIKMEKFSYDVSDHKLLIAEYK